MENVFVKERRMKLTAEEHTDAWWRHQMETFSALLALCAGNSPVPDEFSAQRPVTRSFDVFFDLPLNKRLSKQAWCWWFETLSCPLWRHCNVFEFLYELHPVSVTKFKGMLWVIMTKLYQPFHLLTLLQGSEETCDINRITSANLKLVDIHESRFLLSLLNRWLHKRGSGLGGGGGGGGGGWWPIGLLIPSIIMYLTHWGRGKWTPFRRRHFQMHFLEWKYLNSD